jgi:uncharacterized protein
MRPPLDGRVLVTGASSGIGRELARLLAARARSLVLAARRRDRLEELAVELRGKHPALEVAVHACDLGDLDAVEELARAAGPCDVLINNAGFGDLQLFEQSSWDKLRQMIQVNVVALTRLCALLLPPMLAQRRGGILNVSSGVGLTFLPGAAAYGGTKHFVTAFSESLRLELRGTGVVVSQLCPGPVRTEFFDVAGDLARLPRFLELTAEQCARAALRGFARGRALIIPGLLSKILIGLGRITPRWLLRLTYSVVARAMRRKSGANP